MKTIAVVGRKGGSGKTTICVQLALGLHGVGRSVVLADTDPQRSSFEVLKHKLDETLQVVSSTGGKLASLKNACSRSGVDVLIIDTPAVLEDELAAAVGISDLAVLISRPTFLDLSAAVATSRLIRQLRTDGLILLNQAPAPRLGVESPVVLKAVRAAALLGLEVSPVIVRARGCYQEYLEKALSAQHCAKNPAAQREIADLCNLIEVRVWADSHESSISSSG